MDAVAVTSSMVIEKYGLEWPDMSAMEIERYICREGGYVQRASGKFGNGMLFHFIEFQKHLYGDRKKWHKWNLKQVDLFLTNRTMGILGPASSGKTNGAATDILADWWLFPECTTVLLCSTTKERMQDRIFGEIKKYFKLARERWPELPGRAIDGRMRIVYEDGDFLRDGRDFRNGIIGIPCLGSGDFKGLSEFIGIKNKRVRVLFDELQMLPPSVLMTISNLDKNPDFKLVGLGNPKETNDALGQLCEPAHWLGGWDGNLDQEPITKHWATTRPDGVCLQFVGTDSPNLDGKLGIDLITQSAIDRDIAQYGKDSLQFTMMNQGMMPRGQGSRRVLTAQLCRKHGAMEEPIWMDSTRVKIGSLDAAYGGAGGDRCIFTELHFGPEMEQLDPSTVLVNLVMQDTRARRKRFVLALIDTLVVPINVKDKAEAPEQIVTFIHNLCSTRGIPPENIFYDSGMRTALVNAFAQLWSTKTNPIDCGGSPSEHMVSAQIQVPCNKYYSKFITEIWFNVRYAIEAGQFRGLTKAALDEFAAREWTMVAGNKIEVEPKRKLKEKCFIGGTLVRTPNGHIKIELLQPGDLVETPFGPTMVYEIHENWADTLCETLFSDGSAIISTPDHEFFTWNNGWSRADTLDLNSKVESVRMLWLWKFANLVYTRTTSTTFKERVGIIAAVGTGRALSRRDFYTGLCGLNGLARFLKDMKSIIGMAIGQITAFQTFAWRSAAPTPATILGCAGVTLSSESDNQISGRISSPNPLYGIGLQKEGSGIGQTAERQWQKGNHTPISALSAEKFSWPSGRGRSIARNNAPIPLLGVAITTFARCAKHAVGHLWRLATNRLRTAPRVVQPLQCGKPVKVYDLTLREHNVYYANGILVSNCGRSPDIADSVAIGVLGAIRKGFVIDNLKPVSEKKQDSKWKRDLLERSKKVWRDGELNYSR